MTSTTAQDFSEAHVCYGRPKAKSIKERTMRGKQTYWCVLGLVVLSGLSVSAGEKVAAANPEIGQIGLTGFSPPGGPFQGRVIDGVFADSPADKAGLEFGDQLLAVDGMWVNQIEAEEVFNRLRGPVGSEVRITILRDGENRPEKWDLTRRKINYVKARQGTLGIYVGQGEGKEQIIEGIVPHSPAAQAKLEKGDVIVLADGKELKPQSGWRRYRPFRGDVGSTVTLTIRKQSTEQVEEVTLTRVKTSDYISSASSSPPQPEGSSGLSVSLRDGRVVVDSTISKASPAQQAGIRTGDELVLIDDIVLNNLSYQQVVALLEGPIGKTINVAVKQREDNRIRQIELKLIPRREVVAPLLKNSPYAEFQSPKQR